MQLCIALDLGTFEENMHLVEQLSHFDGWFKVGLRSYIRDGVKIIERIKELAPNAKIFLDLKVYDIPNTMADAAQSIADLGVDMFNVHASAGSRAMQAVMQRLEGMRKRPLVLAVTALTSFDEQEFQALYHQDIASAATQFARNAYDSGLDGVVCSVYESMAIKSSTHDDFLTLTPGIRPFNENAGDQKRVADLNSAIMNKSDFIVVGRPIYQAEHPAEVVSKILKNI